MMMLMMIYFFNSLIPLSGIFLDILLGPCKWTIIDSVHVQFWGWEMVSLLLFSLIMIMFCPSLQVDRWGLVEGGHDVDIADLKVQISCAAVFLGLSKR